MELESQELKKGKGMMAAAQPVRDQASSHVDNTDIIMVITVTAVVMNHCHAMQKLKLSESYNICQGALHPAMVVR